MLHQRGRGAALNTMDWKEGTVIVWSCGQRSASHLSSQVHRLLIQRVKKIANWNIESAHSGSNARRGLESVSETRNYTDFSVNGS